MLPKEKPGFPFLPIQEVYKNKNSLTRWDSQRDAGLDPQNAYYK